VSFRILCSGEILPGFDRQTVSQNIVTRLGMTAEQAATLLSGKEFVLKRGLSAEKVSQYLQHLTEAGLRVSAEVETATAPAQDAATQPPPAPLPTPQSPSAPLVTDPPPLPVPAPLALVEEPAPQVEEIECPRCHEKQPKRTLCRQCALDIPHFMASQQSIEAEQRAEAAAAREADLVRRGLRKPRYQAGDARPPSVLSLSLSGRFSRRAYLLAVLMRTTLIFLLLTVSIALFGPMKFVLILPIVIILGLLWGIRDGALRCHDLGWSGWMSLLQLVPLANSVFFLLLLFLPGQGQENEHGEPPPPTTWGSVIVGIAVVVFSMVCMGLTVNHQMRLLAKQRLQTSQQEVGNPARYHIVMYSLTTCEYCAEKRHQFDEEGIRYTEYFLDEDASAQRDLEGKLQRIGYHGAVATPSFEINGRMLMNNPSMESIHEAMQASPL
jgi:uncharacterized membrane protein YhaH (DUF805 family)/glutaredoxin